MYAARMFIVPPSEIVENPFDSPVAGVIEGWDVYAPDWEGRGGSDLVPHAVIENLHGSLCIRAAGTYWYFGDHSGPAPSNERKCWYQSGHTLRFIRKREKS